MQSITSNEINKNAINENILSLELGYGFHHRYLKATINGYFTKWMNKTMTRANEYSYTEASGDIVNERAIINMSGVNARHMGVELELRSNLTNWLELSAMLSLGDWQWDSNPIGYYYNSLGQPLADLKGTVADAIGSGNHAWSQLNLKGIKVGGSAQTTYNIGATLKPVKDLRIGLTLNGIRLRDRKSVV